MLEDVILIDKDKLLEEVSKIKNDGYRLATITCEKEENSFEFIYHFDKSYRMKNLKMAVTNTDEPVKSISNIYPAAFLIENEYQDLFGFTFEGLIIDYKGTLYLTPEGPKAPMISDDQKGV